MYARKKTLAFIYLVKNGTLAPAPSGNDIEKMLQKCMREWEKPQFKTYDFKMVVYCIKQQLEYLK